MEEIERRCKKCGGPLFHKTKYATYCPKCFFAFRRWMREEEERVRIHEATSIFSGGTQIMGKLSSYLTG